MRHFCAVVETSHLRQAAGILNISPGSLSKSIGNLQRELGKSLLGMNGRNLVVTEEGKAHYHRFKLILSSVDAVLSRTASPSNKRPVITVGTFEVFSTYLLAECVSELRQSHHVRCLELTPGKIEAALVSGEIDLGITYIPIPSPEIATDKIATFSFGVFGHEKARKTPLDALRFAVPTSPLPQNPNQMVALDTWPNTVARDVSCEFQMLQTALLTSSRGLTVLYCPRFLIRLYNTYAHPEAHLHEIQCGMPSSKNYSIYLVRRKTSDETPAHRKLAKHLRLLCKDPK